MQSEQILEIAQTQLIMQMLPTEGMGLGWARFARRDVPNGQRRRVAFLGWVTERRRRVNDKQVI